MGFRRFTNILPSIAGYFCLTTLSAFCFGGPVCAQISVSAPTEAQARQLQSWYAHHVPARFQAHSRLILRELDDSQMSAYLQGDEEDADFSAPENASSHTGDDGAGDIDGVFESHPDRIALRLPASGDLDMFTFAHEYGHYVWFNVLSKDDRHRYETIYRRQRAARRLVTRYAATDCEEGFAEAFSFYASEAPLLARRDPLSYQFLNQWSGAGRS